MSKIIRFIFFCFAVLIWGGMTSAQDATPEATPTPEEAVQLPHWLSGISQITIGQTQAALLVRMQVSESNQYAYGFWEIKGDSGPHFISTFSASLSDNHFSEKLTNYTVKPNVDISIEGDVTSADEVKGIFSYGDSKADFAVAPIEQGAEATPESSSDAGTIKGIVFSPSHFTPVADAQVVLDTAQDGSNAGEVKSDADGNFVFENVPVGAHSLTVEFPLQAAYDYCPNSNGMMFFYPDVYPGVSDMGFAITGTRSDGTSIYNIGAVTANVTGGGTAEEYISVDCQ